MLKGYTKEEKSWMMYDWANSAHSVIVVTLLPIFFSSVAGFMRNTTSAMSIWGYVTSIAMPLYERISKYSKCSIGYTSLLQYIYGLRYGSQPCPFPDLLCHPAQ